MSRSAFASVRWDEKGVPYGMAFDDHYFCVDNGYEEAVHVGVLGNALPERFRELDPNKSGIFTIIETGFGTGLDFCCAWEAWDAFAPASWKLAFVSVELYPVSAEDLGRALGMWPRLAKYREAFLGQYAPVPGGVQKMSFGEGRVHLTVVFNEVVSALKRIREGSLALEGADAWFLDGFGPSKNPGMWREEVFVEVAALSRSGTTFSTFTAAGQVRRLLTKHGFLVRKVPAHGKKKHMLTGTYL
jgi:tRNA 5-methylaminomethyl-2-thiouridine biosynthesis bifunctional protein